MLTRRMLPSARESLADAVPVGGAPVARTPLGHARRHERSGPTGSPQPTADRVRRSQNISSVPYLGSRYNIPCTVRYTHRERDRGLGLSPQTYPFSPLDFISPTKDVIQTPVQPTRRTMFIK